MKLNKIVVVIGLSFLICSAVSAQTVSSAPVNLPVTRIALFSSGVSFVEHSGSVDGKTEIPLRFPYEAVNDVLKSLVIHDEKTANPSVRYTSEDTLLRSLQSLAVDLSGSPGIAEILQSLRGKEVTVETAEKITGRIIGVETAAGVRIDSDGYEHETFTPAVNLYTSGGMKKVMLSEISSIQFTDPKIAEDFSHALDLLATERTGETRTLAVSLPGTGLRPVSLGYITPAPVWKISYRLDLSQKNPVLQGWAIIDNASDTDWEDISLTLVSGRPVSFIQQLYPPYYLSRPEVPLEIAGAAAPDVYDSEMDEYEYAYGLMESAPAMSAKREKSVNRQADGISSGIVQTAGTEKAGDLFLFTLKNPVTIPRRQSAMVPLTEAEIAVEKISVFSGQNATLLEETHPMLCAEIVNKSGLQLPAGPVTVFDEGSYAGDALLGFFTGDDRKIISYAEDLSVRGSIREETNREISAVSISRGVMTIVRTHQQKKIYRLHNAAAENRSIVIEHPITANTTLVEPKKPDAQTAGLYRFNLTLGAGKSVSYTVQEDRPVSETVMLLQQNTDALVYYANSGVIPARIRKALEKAVNSAGILHSWKRR